MSYQSEGDSSGYIKYRFKSAIAGSLTNSKQGCVCKLNLLKKKKLAEMICTFKTNLNVFT